MKAILFALLLVACGGTTTTTDDAGTDSAPACTMTEYGCSFCVPNAPADTCGNIGRYRDDGTVELGCCLGGTPICAEGICVEGSRR